MTKILVVTGSSGGHIFPALSFLDALMESQKEIEALLILPKMPKIKLKFNITNHAQFTGYKIRYVSIAPIGLSIGFKNICALFGFLKGSLQSLFIVLTFRPSVVVGFGSLVSVPAIMLAWLFRIKTLVHEQNVLPGRANMLLARFSDRIAVSFEETRDYLKLRPDKIVYTGCPLRRRLKRTDKSDAFGFFGFDADKFTILVAGGSSGSHRINACFFEAVSAMADKTKFQIIHITGPQDYGLLCNAYKDLNLKIKLFAFLDDMQYAYSICDLAVCRAGATTIAELIYFNLAAIIIPYPFAYEHQLKNARVLEKRGTAMVIADEELDAAVLRLALDGLINNPAKVNLMRSRYQGLIKAEPGNLLVDAALSLN